MNPPPPGTKALQRQVRVSAVLIGLALLAAYSNTFRVPFLFDDSPAIVENESIRDLGNLGRVLSPQLEGGVTTNGRPILNLSFALDHAISGYEVWSYHATNLVIHWLAALALFGLLRRTVPVAIGSQSGRVSQTMTAAVVASLWALHPLQTSAVTYIVQRAESLCGLWMLLTLLAAAHSAESPRSHRWQTVAVIACALGMATKEVAVVTPLLALVFDRTFLAGSFREAWRKRRSFYLSLAATWLVLAMILFTSTGRGTTAGFETVVTPWTYLLTQAGAIVRYLGLAVWPSPLVFDYGTPVVNSVGVVWWQASIVVLLLTASVWAVVRGLAIGFCGAWFFAILAPSSSIVPIASQTVAEHRMYLPLAAVVASLVVSSFNRLKAPKLVFGLCAMLVGIEAACTFKRNEAYQSAEAIWADTTVKMPKSARARINLALELSKAGKDEDALVQLNQALVADPTSADAHFNRGLIFAHRGDLNGASAEYEATLQSFPKHAEALNNLGGILMANGRPREAEALLLRATEVRPAFAGAHANLSGALLELGRSHDALKQANEAARLDPKSSDAEFRKGNALLELGKLEEARAAFRNATTLDPKNADAQNNYANLLVQSGEFEDALSHYDSAINARQDFVEARRNAGLVLAHLGRLQEAKAQFEALVLLRPGEIEFRDRLAELEAQLR